MKTIVVLLVCTAVACLFLEAKGDCPHMDNTDQIVPTGTQVQKECAIYTCDDKGGWSSSGCPAWLCSKISGYREQDNSKPFPECCPGPICVS